VLVGTGTVAFNSTATTGYEDHCSCMIGHAVWATVTVLTLILSLIVITAILITRY
jgi:hypothetical protein